MPDIRRMFAAAGGGASPGALASPAGAGAAAGAGLRDSSLSPAAARLGVCAPAARREVEPYDATRLNTEVSHKPAVGDWMMWLQLLDRASRPPRAPALASGSGATRPRPRAARAAQAAARSLRADAWPRLPRARVRDA